MQQTFARKKSEGKAQDKGTRPILAFLKPLGGGSSGVKGLGEQPAAAAARAPAALQANPRLALPGGSKPAGKQPGLFDFADSSDDEEGEEEAPVKRAAARPKAQPLRPLGQRPAAAAVAAEPKPKPTAGKATAPSKQGFAGLTDSDSELDGSFGGGPAAAARAVTKAVRGPGVLDGWKPPGRRQQQRQAPAWEGDAPAGKADGGEARLAAGYEREGSSGGGSEDGDNSEGSERPAAGGTASASDWAPDESADSGSDSRGSAVEEEEAPVPNGSKGPAPKAAAVPAGRKSSKGSMPGGGVTAGGKLAGGVAAPGGKRKRAQDAAVTGVSVAAAAAAADGAAEAALAQGAGQGGGKPKKAVGARKASKAHASSLPVLLPKALAKSTAEAAHLLCELEPPKDSEGRALGAMAHAVSLEGDSGPVGRVLVPESGRFQVDLKGILYETEAVPLPCTLALVHTKNAGSELVVEQLFSSVLRCEPGQDFMRENEAALWEMEAYDSDRHAGGSEDEEGGGKRAKGGKGGKGGRAKPAGGRGRGGRKPAGGRGKGGGAGKGAGKKAAAPRKRTAPKPKAAGGGAASGGRKPAAKKARASKAAAEADASSGSDWEAGFE